MRIKLIIKFFTLGFCTIGAIFLNLDNISWIQDVLSLGLDAYIIILVVCLIVLGIHNELNYTLDYLFTLIGATLNFTGGVMAIVYYFGYYERLHLPIPPSNLLPVGLSALLASICMIADLTMSILNKIRSGDTMND